MKKALNIIVLGMILFCVASCSVLLAGCTYNRNAELFRIDVNANGNTVPVSAMP